MLPLPMNLKAGRRSNAALPTQWFMGSMHEILFRRSLSLTLSPSDGAGEITPRECTLRRFFSLSPSDGERVRERGE